MISHTIAIATQCAYRCIDAGDYPLLDQFRKQQVPAARIDSCHCFLQFDDSLRDLTVAALLSETAGQIRKS